MNPSQVRTEILTDHAVLRRLVDVVELAARDAADDIPPDDAEQRLRDALSVLGRELERHLDLEDGLLVPALREIDAWGEIRAARVTEDHARQRLALRELADARTSFDEDVNGLIVLALILVAELRCDMVDEERSVLGPNLLRDDPLTLDQSDG